MSSTGMRPCSAAATAGDRAAALIHQFLCRAGVSSGAGWLDHFDRGFGFEALGVSSAFSIKFGSARFLSNEECRGFPSFPGDAAEPIARVARPASRRRFVPKASLLVRPTVIVATLLLGVGVALQGFPRSAEGARITPAPALDETAQAATGEVAMMGSGKSRTRCSMSFRFVAGSSLEERRFEPSVPQGGTGQAARMSNSQEGKRRRMIRSGQIGLPIHW
jgi:hypothetical protein